MQNKQPFLLRYYLSENKQFVSDTLTLLTTGRASEDIPREEENDLISAPPSIQYASPSAPSRVIKPGGPVSAI